MRLLFFLLISLSLLAQFPPGDADGNGHVDAQDLSALEEHFLTGAALAGSGDCNLDGVLDFLDLICTIRRQTGLLRLTSPGEGESDVAVTRETIFHFAVPVDPASFEGAIAVFSGDSALTFQTHFSPDLLTLTLFYEVLPAAAQILVQIDERPLLSAYGSPLSLDPDPSEFGTFELRFSTLGLHLVPGTSICGRVFASAPGTSGGRTVDQGLPNVKITVDGAEDELFTFTDSLGNFRLDPAPSGSFFVHVDGRTSTVALPQGAYYPFVGKTWRAQPGREISVGNIFLPLIQPDALTPTVPDQETLCVFSPSVLQDFPFMAGTSLTVPADSLFADDGSRGGAVGIAPVAPDRLPGPLPEGLAFPIVITVQTDGATNFDRPARLCLPNLADPLDGTLLPPGSKTALISFNHDSGRFEAVGTMTVSEDGLMVCSDPGQGIRAPGWHGSSNRVNGGGGNSSRHGGGNGGDGGGGGDGDNNGNGDRGEDDKNREDKEEKGKEDKPPGEPGSDEERCHKDDDEETKEDEAVDPVYLFSGEFYHHELDLRVPGRGLDFIWSRKYRAQLVTQSAIGNGWDFSYNILLKYADCGQIDPSNCELILYDGNTRRDRYHRQPNGSYSRSEKFQELSKQPDGGFLMLFPNRGSWRFFPLDGRPAQGKIQQISDSNGNSLRFGYDGLGRLSLVTDTLEREYRIEYQDSGADARIARLIDFSGRVVAYEHCEPTDGDGNPGDLKACISPAVSGTPTGNDFPNGTRTSYTYQKAGPGVPEALIGNLLTITDGRRNDPRDPSFGSGPWLVNHYDPFDRLVTQIWGGDRVDVFYEPLYPGPANGWARSRTIVNDRMGNVKEYWWDDRNRCIRKRDYSGRANPSQPTTSSSNRPSGKLRASDPDFFETTYAWNLDSLKSRVVHPNGTISEYLYERDLNPNAPIRQRGNLRIKRRLPGSHQPAGDQPVIEERFSYDERFGCGGCGSSYLTEHRDGRGNTRRFAYDDKGNRIREEERLAEISWEHEYNEFGQIVRCTRPENGSGHRRVDRYDYYESGPSRGYLRSTTLDEGFENLTTSYEYDARGNRTRIIDPRGLDRLYRFNQLDQLVQFDSSEVAPQSGIRYTTSYHYDANRNLVQVEVENRDDQGVLQANASFSKFLEYEVLNHLVRQTEEIDEGRYLVKEFQYDRNRYRTLTRYGESVNGNQPTNSLALLYDERNLLHQVIRAEGDPLQSTTQYDYDPNGNKIRELHGLESEPQITRMIYDGYNRLVEQEDAQGNRWLWSYDANHNRVSERILGENLDVEGGRDNLRLSEERNQYDELNRLIRRETAFFESETQAELGDGLVVTQYVYNPLSQVIREIDDNGHQKSWDYDGAERLAGFTDAKGNRLSYLYDPNSNLIETLSRELSAEGEVQDYVNRWEYDGLNRQIASVDSLGNRRTGHYDSRGNLVRSFDALRASALAPGNEVRYRYDGLNRLLEEERIMSEDGMGQGHASGSILISREWDDSSRLIAQVDGNGNRTSYRYDPLDRVSVTLFADGAQTQASYDVRNNLELYEDANGSVVRFSHDRLNRLTQVQVQPGAGVSAETSYELRKYDGRSRLVYGEDNDSQLRFSYDSLGRVLAETLNGQTSASSFDGVGNRVQARYPSGDLVRTDYDELDRPRLIRLGDGQVAAYTYDGFRRIATKTMGNQTQMAHEYDGAKRISGTKQHRIGDNGGQPFDERSYSWDGMHNKTGMSESQGGEGREWRYDSLYRLRESGRSSFDVELERIGYELDAVGNRQQVTGGPDAGDYGLEDQQKRLQDRQMNQYSSTPFDERHYDENGNLVLVRPEGVGRDVNLEYNYRNQPVLWYESGANDYWLYKYDILGRRIEKSRVGLQGEQSTKYYYQGARLCEEQREEQKQALYVYGSYLDEVLLMERAGQAYYYHSDDQFNVVRLSNGAGEVVESYRYGDYGSVTIQDGNGMPRASSAVGNPLLFQGRYLDAESGWYNYRNRYLDPRAGRFTTRDPIGIWGDNYNNGNAFAFVGNNPWTMLDPFGLYCSCNPMLDDPDIRDAIRETWEKTLQSDNAEGFWETMADIFGADIKPNEHGFTIKNNNGDYTTGDVIEGDDHEVDVISLLQGPTTSDSGDSGTGHSHTMASSAGAAPSYNVSAMGTSGDIVMAEHFGLKDNLVIGYDPDAKGANGSIDKSEWVVITYDGGGRIDKFRLFDLLDTPCTSTEQKECCGN